MGRGGGKTNLAVTLDACALLGIRDPTEFYALPAHLRDLWYEHALNGWSGRYDATKKRGKELPASPAEHAAERAAIAARGPK